MAGTTTRFKTQVLWFLILISPISAITNTTLRLPSTLGCPPTLDLPFLDSFLNNTLSLVDKLRSLPPNSFGSKVITHLNADETIGWVPIDSTVTSPLISAATQCEITSSMPFIPASKLSILKITQYMKSNQIDKTLYLPLHFSNSKTLGSNLLDITDKFPFKAKGSHGTFTLNPTSQSIDTETHESSDPISNTSGLICLTSRTDNPLMRKTYQIIAEKLIIMNELTSTLHSTITELKVNLSSPTPQANNASWSPLPCFPILLRPLPNPPGLSTPLYLTEINSAPTLASINTLHEYLAIMAKRLSIIAKSHLHDPDQDPLLLSNSPDSLSEWFQLLNPASYEGNISIVGIVVLLGGVPLLLILLCMLFCLYRRGMFLFFSTHTQVPTDIR